MPEQLEHISASPIKVPYVVIGRLPQYVRILNQLKQIVAINNNWNVLLIGVERLDRAILSYPGFTPNGFHIVTSADSEPYYHRTNNRRFSHKMPLTPCTH